MVFPGEMTGAAHRAQLWADMRRALLKLLQDGEGKRALHADLAIRTVSCVGDEAIRDVLTIVEDHEQREVAAVNEWHLLRREPAPLRSKTSTVGGTRHR